MMRRATLLVTLGVSVLALLAVVVGAALATTPKGVTPTLLTVVCWRRKRRVSRGGTTAADKPRRAIESPREAPSSTLPTLRELTATVFNKGSLTRATLGNFEAENQGIEVESQSTSADFALAKLVIEPGGTTGWHHHPGVALVSVNSGSVTEYDKNCH